MSITKWILSALCAVLIAAPAFAAPPAIPPGAPFQNVNSIPNVYNFTPTSLPRYRAALARAQSGPVTYTTGNAATVTYSGSTVTITFASAVPNLAAGQIVNVSGITGITGTINGTWPLATGTSGGTVFTYTVGSISGTVGGTAVVQGGSPPVQIAFMGDSTTMGAGSGTSGCLLSFGAKAQSWPSQLAKLYNRHGIVASTDSDWGNALLQASNCTASAPSDYALYDPKNAFAGSTWAFTGGAGQTVGGLNFSNSSGTDIWSFTPAVATDTIAVWSFCYSGNSGAAFTVSDNASLLGTVTSSGACASSGSGALVQSLFTRTSSTNPVKIARTGGNVIIAGLDTFASGAATTPTQVRINNWGAYGSASAFWLTNTFNHFPYPAAPAINPDLVVIDLGINDYRGAVSAATFQSNMQSIITNLKTQNIDIVLVRPEPDNAPVNSAIYAQYQSVYYSLAKANGIPLVDINARLGTWAKAQANGEYGSNGGNDAIHMSQIGYADISQALWQVLRPQ